MADQWYYWHDAEVLGPFSGKQLFALATSGDIVSTDTVWKDGVESGVQASRVEHLFPIAPASLLVGGDLPNSMAVAAAVVPEAVAADAKVAVAEVKSEPAPRWDVVNRAKAGKSRAVAGKGAIIMAQDGTNVKFKKKCTTCGWEDSSWKSMPITRGTLRVNFYCEKCRRQRQVELTCFAS
jgi:hypothetical protein